MNEILKKYRDRLEIIEKFIQASKMIMHKQIDSFMISGVETINSDNCIECFKISSAQRNLLMDVIKDLENLKTE